MSNKGEKMFVKKIKKGVDILNMLLYNNSCVTGKEKKQTGEQVENLTEYRGVAQLG